MNNEQKKPLVSIIILNYNAGSLLLDCINSILKTNYQNYEIIIVDNESNDHSHIKCKEKFPEIQLIENTKNLGYCEGNNVGIRKAKGDYILVLNPDTIVDPMWLDHLLSAYEKCGAGLYQPKILSLHEKNILQSTGNMIHLFGFGFSRDKGVQDYHQTNIEEIGYASGTCLFTSALIFDQLNLFDPFIFLYHDDLDLGWRAKQKGLKSYFVPESIIYHYESYSLKWSQKKFFWLERNRRYCLKTHYSKETYKKIRFYLFLNELLVWIFYISKGYFFAKLKAEINLMKNKDHIIKKYTDIESDKIISDIDIIMSFPDQIMVPKNVSEGIMSRTFIKILEKLSFKAKMKLH